MMYAALGMPAEPFKDVTVYSPALPAGSAGNRSSRVDALRLSWDFNEVFWYLRYMINGEAYSDEKVISFLAEFREHCLQNPDPAKRIDTFDKLDAWFARQLAEAEENESQYAWRSHHKATVWRMRRMLTGIPARGSGLFTKSNAKANEDVPAEGWIGGQIIVVDIAGLQQEIQSLVIARTLERILSSAEDGKLGVDHLVVVADELNAFAPSQGGEMAHVRKVLQRVSTQGRYAGISLWGAGQKLSKVDEMVRDNAATRALGVTSDGELSSGVYGRMPSGLVERIATLPKGWMALSHYSFRSIMLARFPRPAWQTGKAKTTGGQKLGTTSVLGLSSRSVERLTEGVSPELADKLISDSSSAEEARKRLENARVPDMSKVALHEPTSFDPENPFDMA
jgi:hypothetical protein